MTTCYGPWNALECNLTFNIHEKYTYHSAGAAITKYHRLGGLSNRNLFSHSSPLRPRCQDGQFLVRLLFLTCRQPPSWCPHMGFSLGSWRQERQTETERGLERLFRTEHQFCELEPILITLFNFNYLFRGPDIS